MRWTCQNCWNFSANNGSNCHQCRYYPMLIPPILDMLLLRAQTWESSKRLTWNSGWSQDSTVAVIATTMSKLSGRMILLAMRRYISRREFNKPCWPKIFLKISTRFGQNRFNGFCSIKAPVIWSKWEEAWWIFEKISESLYFCKNKYRLHLSHF